MPMLTLHLLLGHGLVTMDLKTKRMWEPDVFLTFLQKCDAFLPTTYDWMHTGDTSTWTSNANGQTARCDYFFLPLAWQQATISTYGVDTVDTGLAGEDHAALRICVLYICDKEKRDAGEL